MLELDDGLSDDSGLSTGGNSLLNPSELSYDVKVSLVRICSMIEQLPFSDESYDLLKRINFEIKRNIELYVPKNPSESVQTNLNPQGSQLGTCFSQPAFLIGHSVPSRIACDRLVSGSERSRTFNSTQNTFTSFKRHDISKVLNSSTLHSSNFHTNGTNDPESSIFNYKPLSNLNVSTIDESMAEDDAESDISTMTENSDTFFLMRNWSLKKDGNNLYLTGIKLDRKGNLLERDFISKKVISRTPELLVKTDCGNYRLDDPLIDPKNCIPQEVKELFMKDKSYFPKFWRKALALWNEIEQKELNVQKLKKKSENQEKENDSGKSKKNSPLDMKNNSNKGGKKTQENEPGKSKRNSSLEAKNSFNKGRKKVQENELAKPKRKSLLEDKTSGTKAQKKAHENEPGKSKKNSPPLEIKNSASKVQKKTQRKEELSKQQKKNDTVKSSKQQEKNKKKEDIQPTKKAKNDDKPSKAAAKKKLIPVEEEEASENELVDFGDDSMFQIPSTSLTPTGLLASITKTTIKGRYTPPTNVFDNIYGKSTTPCSNASTLDDSFDGAPKDKSVVKRMAKAKSAPSGAKPSQKLLLDSKVSQKPTLPQLDEESNQLIDMVLDAVHTQTTQTPEIVKKVFRSNDFREDEEESSDDNEDDGNM